MYTELLFTAFMFDGQNEWEVKWRQIVQSDTQADPDAEAAAVLSTAKTSWNITLGGQQVRGRFVQDVQATIGTTSMHPFT